MTPFLGSFRLRVVLSKRPTAEWWARPPGPYSGFEIGRSIHDFRSSLIATYRARNSTHLLINESVYQDHREWRYSDVQTHQRGRLEPWWSHLHIERQIFPWLKWIKTYQYQSTTDHWSKFLISWAHWIVVVLRKYRNSVLLPWHYGRIVNQAIVVA